MVPLSTLDDVALLRETVEVECKLAPGRDGQGKLPRDFWPTYSAFANSGGGIVILGLHEKREGFDVGGVSNLEGICTDLHNMLNNRQKVSANLLTDQHIHSLSIEGKKLLVIDVPAASRKDKPVYINGNPMTGTYRRLHDGDRLCDAEIVKRMLAEQTDDTRDNRVLPGFGLSDLSEESVRAYRQMMRDRSPPHPFLDATNPEFLRQIGAFRRIRESDLEGLTVAGLLMFGKAENIQDEFPNYFLDYQERPEPRTERRWVDRVTLDGTLFDFYRRVYRKLVADLKVPFALHNGQRQDETPVHEALREALVNCIVHADYRPRLGTRS